MASSIESMVMSLGMRSGAEALRIDAITLFVALLCASILIGHLLERTSWINESITALVIGLCTGVIILLITKGKSSHLFVFNEELFFIYVLPPIIFNAGFQVKKKRFFENFMTIMSFGIIGTLISFFIIFFGAEKLFNKLGIDYLDTGDFLALGAIFSATDSVCTLQVLNQEQTPLLYSLVFGEGVVNDATSVVLFNAIQRFDLSHITSGLALQLLGNFIYLFVTSTLLGVVVGLASAYVIKKLYFGRHSTDREVALMFIMAYMSYIMAEVFNLSAILTVFFCGIVMSHYTWHNVTESSRVTTRHAFASMSFIAEIFIFLYVGMDALDIEKWKVVEKSPGTSVGASSIILGLVLIGRAAFIFPLSFVSNLTRKSQDDKITLNKQVVIWWAGLMRGAVSMALAYNKFTSSGHTQLRGNAIMITSTITVVLFSTGVFGLLTKPLIKVLLMRRDSNSSSTRSSELTALADSKSLTLPLLDGEKDPESDTRSNCICRPKSFRMLLKTPTNAVHYYWRKLDDSFMRPVFGGRGYSPYDPGSLTQGSLH